MNGSFFIRYFFFFATIFSYLSLQAQVLQYENQKIDKIEVLLHTQNGIATDQNAIISRMTTKEGSFFSQAEFDEDLKTLAQDYDRIEPAIETSDGCLKVTIELWKKPLLVSIEWCGNRSIKTNRLQSELNIPCNAPFNALEFNSAFNKLRNYYIKKGYFESQLSYEVENDCETNQVKIKVFIKEGRSGKIQKLVFVNFSADEESAVLHQMMTKKYNIFLSWLNDEGIYNEEAIQQDRLVITNYLQNQGYADAQVDLTVTEACNSKDRIIVTFTADKGERYSFGTLSFEGNSLICDEEIDRLFEMRRNEPYSLEKVRDTIEKINLAYGKFGYIDSLVDFEAELDPCTLCYHLHFSIEEGDQYKVGLIKVFGNCVTKTNVILHETLIVPGELFNTAKLKATESRLANIGYFKHVNVYFVKGTESSLGNNYRDVYIEVEETGTGSFSAFLGYSTAEELFGGINVTEKNFNYEGFYYYMRDGISAFRGGGEYAHLTAQIGQKSRNYTISWTKPYFMDTQWVIGFDLTKTNTRYISNDYAIETIALILRAQYNVNSFLRLGLQYRLKNGGLIIHKLHKEDSKELAKASDLNDLISAFGVSLNYDSTDHPVKPRNGLKSKLFIEYAGLLGRHNFVSLGYLNSFYMSVGSRMVLKYRADFRFIQPLFSTTASTIPVDERIFMGGDFNVRGYRPYRLGPRFKGDSDAPKGGISLQFYSAELTRRLTQSFEAFIFFDAGHLSDLTWEFGRMSTSVGLGMNCKFLDSLPPIIFGMGYPLNARGRREVKRFFISVGGNF